MRICSSCPARRRQAAKKLNKKGFESGFGKSGGRVDHGLPQPYSEVCREPVFEMEGKQVSDFLGLSFTIKMTPKKVFDTSSSSFTFNGINWIKIGDVSIESRYITKTKQRIIPEGEKHSRKVQKGDLILSNSMSFGRPYILKIEGCIHDGWLLMTDFNENLNKDYLYEILSYKTTQLQFTQSAGGGVVQNLNSERVRAVKIPLPPINIQQQIVKECEAIDKAVAEAQETVETVKLEIEEKVKAESQKYELQRLTKFVKIISGGTPKTNIAEYWNGNIPWLSVADFSKVNRFVEKTEKHITELGLENSSTRYLNKGDLIISARGTVGALAELIIPMTFNQSCYGLRGNDQLNNGYLFYILKQEIKQLKDKATGVTFGAIIKSTFDSIEIPVPPIIEQEKLITEITALENKIKSAEAIINAASEQKQAVMKEYL